ncbi:ROK family transcriptional regulator [Arthrobacter sp. ISL-5]|nr:ROK family transcriptional regulator [Arthrobacter sp. ISL-5]
MPRHTRTSPNKGFLGVSAGALAVLETLLDGRPRTRVRIADMIGVARSTVALRVDELVSAGLARFEEDPVYSGGRPSMRIQLVPDSRIVLAVDIGANHAVTGLVDLNSRLIVQRRREVDVATRPEEILSWVMDAAASLLAGKAWDVSRLAAVGVGLAAPIEHATLRPINPPIMPLWDGFDAVSWFQGRLDVPVLVEKDVNLMALGERRLKWPKTQNLLFAKLSTGIGAGLILDGKLYRGEQGTAGDIGHVRLSRDMDTPCHCGNHGCLEALASVPSLIAKLQGEGQGLESGSDIIELLKAGNIDAVQAVRQAGRDLGEVLASTVSLINPSVIVIGGSLASVGEHLITGVREIVFARAMPLSTKGLSIVQAAPGSNAALIGAGVLAVNHVLHAT